MGVRQRNGGLNTGAVLKLPAALEIYEVHSARRQAGIAFGVRCSCSDDIVRVDVLGIYASERPDRTEYPRAYPVCDAQTMHVLDTLRLWRQRRDVQESAPRTDLKNLIERGEDRTGVLGAEIV